MCTYICVSIFNIYLCVFFVNFVVCKNFNLSYYRTLSLIHPVRTVCTYNIDKTLHPSTPSRNVFLHARHSMTRHPNDAKSAVASLIFIFGLYFSFRPSFRLAFPGLATAINWNRRRASVITVGGRRATASQRGFFFFFGGGGNLLRR